MKYINLTPSPWAFPPWLEPLALAAVLFLSASETPKPPVPLRNGGLKLIGYVGRLLEAPHLFIHFRSPVSALIVFVLFGLEAVPFTVHCLAPQFVFSMIGEYGEWWGIDVRPSTCRPLLKQPVQRLCRFKQSAAPTKPLIQISSCFVLCNTCVKNRRQHLVCWRLILWILTQYIDFIAFLGLTRIVVDYEFIG